MKYGLHIGKEIKTKLNESGMTVTAFAERINKERSGVYKIFNEQSINTELLMHISEILNYNFFELYAKSNELNEPSVHYDRKKRKKVSVQIEINDPHKENEIFKILNLNI